MLSVSQLFTYLPACVSGHLLAHPSICPPGRQLPNDANVEAFGDCAKTHDSRRSLPKARREGIAQKPLQAVPLRVIHGATPLLAPVIRAEMHQV